MARTKKPSGLRPKPPKVAKLNRRSAFREPLCDIVAVCEGKVTEPEYIRWFKNQHRHPLVHVESVPGVGVPKTVVSRAIEILRERQDASRRDQDRLNKLIQVWVVFDRDDHDSYEQAIIDATKAGLHLADSNPCFELWGVLHFRDQTASIDRVKIQKDLASLMQGYDHEASPRFICDTLEDSHDQAVVRAKNLEDRCREAGNPCGNPSTRVHNLTTSISTAMDQLARRQQAAARRADL